MQHASGGHHSVRRAEHRVQGVYVRAFQQDFQHVVRGAPCDRAKRHGKCSSRHHSLQDPLPYHRRLSERKRLGPVRQQRQCDLLRAVHRRGGEGSRDHRPLPQPCRRSALRGVLLGQHLPRGALRCVRQTGPLPVCRSQLHEHQCGWPARRRLFGTNHPPQRQRPDGEGDEAMRLRGYGRREEEKGGKLHISNF